MKTYVYVCYNRNKNRTGDAAFKQEHCLRVVHNSHYKCYNIHAGENDGTYDSEYLFYFLHNQIITDFYNNMEIC